jgi:hypothetical protein
VRVIIRCLILNQHDDYAAAKRSCLGTWECNKCGSTLLPTTETKVRLGISVGSVARPPPYPHLRFARRLPYGSRNRVARDMGRKIYSCIFPYSSNSSNRFHTPVVFTATITRNFTVSSTVHLTVVYLPQSDMSDADESGSPMLSTDVDLIRPLLDDFKSAKKGERRHVVRRGVTTIMASKDISHLRPLAQAKIIARVKEVCLEISYISTSC